jgi:hypothetical protein
MHTDKDKRAKKKSYRCQVQYYNMKTFFIAMIPQRKKKTSTLTIKKECLDLYQRKIITSNST